MAFLTVLLASLARRTRPFGLPLGASVAEGTPLFGPPREREWSPEWFLHPPGGVQQEGAAGGARSKATVTDRRSALVARANDEANALDAVCAARQGPQRKTATNTALLK